ncbi:hypothetical protein Tco_1112121 [Tanacetum coccineum]|uniref:Uncharacterized protein n=1 Tax=Tanacetum coccineum TaxID=301880 RepID=A0ABQ5IR83_9ASTR
MPKICLPLRKRPRRTTPGPGYEVGESSAAGAARQVGPSTARANQYDLLNVNPALKMPDKEAKYLVPLVHSRWMLRSVTFEGITLSVLRSWAQDSEIVEIFASSRPTATTRNGDDSHTSGIGVRRNERAARECTYQDFMKCQPLFFRGTERVVELTQWFERIGNRVSHKINTFAERQAENKRKFEDTPRNNQNQQQNKRQNTGRAYAAGNGDKKQYEGTKPLCPKCNFQPVRSSIPTCNNCNKLGRPGQGLATTRRTALWKKQENQGNGNTVAKAYAVGVAGHNPDKNTYDKVTSPQTRQVECTSRPSNLVARAPLSIGGPIINERIGGSTTKLFDKVFIRPMFITLGAPVLFVKKKDGTFYKDRQTNDQATSKEVSSYEWGDKQEATPLLKQKLCSAPILALPEGKRRFYLQDPRKNYTTYDLELGAVVFRLRNLEALSCKPLDRQKSYQNLKRKPDGVRDCRGTKEITDREVKRLKRSRIHNSKGSMERPKRGPEFTWNAKSSFGRKYQLFLKDRAVDKKLERFKPCVQSLA